MRFPHFLALGVFLVALAFLGALSQGQAPGQQGTTQHPNHLGVTIPQEATQQVKATTKVVQGQPCTTWRVVTTWETKGSTTSQDSMSWQGDCPQTPSRP